MKTKTAVILALCCVLIIAAVLAFVLPSAASEDPVTKANGANFAALLTDLVASADDPDHADQSIIQADLEAIKAVDSGDGKIAASIANHWQKVFLDPDYHLYIHQGNDSAQELVQAGIPNSRRHAIVILGYQLQDGQMQPELVGRCEAAAAAARALPETILVCSGGATGDNNPEGNTEAGLMKAYLVEHCGIDASRIYIDEAAMTTAENALNTLKILQKQKVHSMTIVTSTYHQAWGQADYNAVAAIYSRQHNYDVEIIGNYCYDIEPATEMYRTGWKIAGFQIAGILELPDEAMKQVPSPFGKRPSQEPAAEVQPEPVPEAVPPENGTPDYADPACWAYYETELEKPADVFLICPTVDTQSEYNMDLSNEKVKANFLGALNMERGIYEEQGRMFAPYYRQASLKTYELERDQWEQYLAFAYEDVSAAFSWYLDHENNGRPIILAGFSQGADMCYRLLEEYFGSEILYGRLVAVYAIGWPCTEELVQEYPQIVPAQSAEDVGTVISFECEAPDVKETFILPEGIKAFSINPLNWRTDATPADKSLNTGACFTDYSANIIREEAELCGCYIEEGRGALKVTDVDSADYPPVLSIFPEGAYHLYDYQFFYRNLQSNVETRLNAWMEKSAIDLASAA